MFQREIQFITDFTINKIKNLENSISISDLIKADVHPAIINYFVGQIGIMMNSERQKIIKESIFDYSGKSINKYFNLIDEELKKKTKFDSSMVIKAVNISVSFHINHIVRPKFTLVKFLFNKEEEKSTHDIKLLLNNFYYYDYYSDLIIKYLEKKKIEKLLREEFEEIYDKIDKLIIDSYSYSLFENHINGICDFINIGDVNKNKMQLYAFELFLGEKGLTEYILLLKENYGDDLKLKIDKNELLNFVKNNPLNVVKQNRKFKLEQAEEENLIPNSLQIKKEKENIIEAREVVVNITSESNLPDNSNKTDEETVSKLNELTIEVSDEKTEETVENIFIEESINNDEESINNDEIVPINNETEVSIISENALNTETTDSIDVIENETIYTKEDTDILTDSTIANDGYLKNEEMITQEENKTVEIIEEIVLDETEEYVFETIQDEIIDKTLDETLINNEQIIDKYEGDNSSKEYINELLEEEELKIEFEDKDTKSFSIDTNLTDSQINLTEDRKEDDIKSSDEIVKTEIAVKDSAINVMDLMDEKEINKVIKNLFNDDYEEFAENVEKMGQLESIDETITYINTYCNNMGISENRKEVILFKKLITHYFKR